MLGAIVQASADVATVSRPARVAVAFTLNTLAVATAALSVTGATSIAMSTTPSIDARAQAVEALAVTRASITLLIFFTLAMAVFLAAIIACVALVRANTLHLVSNRNADTVSGAG